ncbi:group II intron maturase-specific domain-containing protein [Rhodococcus baikonurensis]|uniref:group II intron maturase-specific domain-containing protein n=1 Tax=Rhodococcus baikonurensis TaxID=172041 RepID=UPI00378F38F7
MSTPIRRRKRCFRSWRRCGRCRRKRIRHGLADLLGRLNPVLRGWCAYFHPRCVESDLRIPRFLCLAPGSPMAAQTAANESRGRISIGVS